MKLHAPLPPKFPRLNPIDKIPQLLRKKWLYKRKFRNHKAIVENRWHAQIRFTDQPWRITSIGPRGRAHRFW
jgi:hypothetical protein